MTTWTQIDSKDSPTAGVFDFASLTLTGYSVIQIVCTGITVTTDGTDIALTFYVASSEVTSGYRWGNQTITSGDVLDDGDISDPSILLNSNNANFDTGNAAGEGFGAVVTVDAPTSTALYKKAEIESVMTGPTGVVIGVAGIGIMENTGAIDGLKIAGSSDLTAGKVRILGLA